MDYLKKLLQTLKPGPSAAPTPPALRNGRLHPLAPIDWQRYLYPAGSGWQQAVALAEAGPRVLIATSIGGHMAMTSVESLLGVALTLRGARVNFLLCDHFLPACLQAISTKFTGPGEFVRDGPQQVMCTSCFKGGTNSYQPLGLPIHHYSKLVTADERQAARTAAASLPAGNLGTHRLDGLAAGEHAMANTVRYFTKANFDDEPDGEGVLRRYLEAALLSIYAVRRLFDQVDFQAACFHHGIYVPQGLIGEVARERELRVINWVPAYRKQCFIFSHGDSYHHVMMNEANAAWEDLPWTPAMEQQLLDYLESRWTGSGDWIGAPEKRDQALNSVAAAVGADFSRPCIGLLTNVAWDAQIMYRGNTFSGMFEWLIATVRHFAARPDLQLIIRVHPAEVRGTLPSRQNVVAELRQTFPQWPANVFVIPPESDLNTYAVMELCDSVLIYGTKTGVELTSRGIPVIVAGEAWIRNKGISFDTSSPEEYFQLLDQLPFGQRLSPEVTRRARQYAYHFFFRRMNPIAAMQPNAGWPPFKLEIESLDDLRPGRDPGLDLICQGILEGSEFAFPAERYLEPAAVEATP